MGDNSPWVRIKSTPSHEQQKLTVLLLIYGRARSAYHLQNPSIHTAPKKEGLQTNILTAFNALSDSAYKQVITGFENNSEWNQPHLPLLRGYNTVTLPSDGNGRVHEH